MSTTISIPGDIGSRITVSVNGVQYIYATGSTVEVPDEVAEVIGNMLGWNTDPPAPRQPAVEEELLGFQASQDMISALDHLYERVHELSEYVVKFVHFDPVTGTLDATWQQIADAMQTHAVGVIAMSEDEGAPEIAHDYIILARANEEVGYMLATAQGMMYTAETADGYPGAGGGLIDAGNGTGAV